MNVSKNVALSLALAVLAACSTTTEDRAARSNSMDNTLISIGKGGEYRFVLDESPTMLARVREQCQEQQTEGELEACVNQVRVQGANEGFRFTPIDGERVLLRSFGVDEETGEEEVFFGGTFTLRASEGNIVILEAIGALEGPRAPKLDGRSIPIEVVDDATFAMQDPNGKGRMVFRRAG